MRRRTAINGIFHEDAVFYDPKGGIFRGRDEIDRIAGVIKATHPDFEYQPLFPPEELSDAGRVRWASGSPGKPPAYAETDLIVAGNGRIASVYLFFDKRSESSASVAVMMSLYAAECAKAGGRSGDTTPGTSNAKPMKRKRCKTEQRSQRLGAWPAAECWPDVPGSDDRPRDGVESDGNEKTAIG